MKTRVVFFDRVALELSVERTRDGRANIRGAYAKFLGRPNDPHVTFIFEARDGLFTPHFSARFRATGRDGTSSRRSRRSGSSGR